MAYNYSDALLLPIPNVTLVPEEDNLTATVTSHWMFRRYVNDVLVPAVQGFGLIGNLASLIVFCHKRLRHGFDEIEQSATVGLVALAVSDFCFCLTGFPAIFRNNTFVGNNGHLLLMALYYRTYYRSFLNLFVFTSTWITVLLSMERYAVVCRPYAAQKFIRVRRTVVICVVIYLISIAFNMPHFFRYKVKCDMDLCYSAHMTSIFPSESAIDAYTIAWNILGTLFPLLLLIFSNVRLIAAIQKSQVRGIVDPERYCTSRITRVLVTIVCLYLFLVCPSMVLAVLYDHFGEYRGYTIALVVTNFTQAVNFSINFVLYFAMCKQFRQVVIRKICRRSSQTKTSSKGRQAQQRYQLVHVQSCAKQSPRY